MIRRLIVLASSAIMYGLALIMSPYLWWGSFICFVPLFYLGARRYLTFGEGFFYGAALWTIGGWGILTSLFSLATGPLPVRLLPLIFIITIEATAAGLWFWTTSKLLSRAQVTSYYTRLLIWIVTTYAFFYWVIHLSLSMFNYWEGYFLMYPLLPLAEYPQLLSTMPFVGKGVLMWLLLITNGACTLPLLTKKKFMWLLAPLIGFLPWYLSMHYAPKKKNPPAWVSKIAHLPMRWVPGLSLMETAELVQKEIAALVKKYPETELILFPESALYRLNLDTSREIAQNWNAQSVGKPLNLLIGAFKWEGIVQRNTAYWFYDGIVQGSFNKRHTMAVTETISWYNISFLRTLFHGKLPSVQPSDNPRVPFQIFKEVSFTPYICSELFFSDRPDDQYPKSPIITLSNDHWAQSDYIRRLMFLAARFKAIEWQRPIVYASYYHSGFIDIDGRVTPIQ